MNRSRAELANLVNFFQIPGQLVSASAFGGGHINETFASEFSDAGRTFGYIHQRINSRVFASPAAVMANVTEVTAHLRGKIRSAGGEPERQTLTLIPTREGRLFHVDGDGEYWRTYRRIERTRTYEVATDPRQVFQAARAFGRLVALLADLPVTRLQETIVGFGDFHQRLAALQQALKLDAVSRSSSARPEIDFALARLDRATLLTDLLARSEVPRRVIHFDTKLNNVLLDEHSDEAVCVIDLDTVMPGTLLYDYGDLVRASASTATEDEQDLERVGIDQELFLQLTRGYLAETRDIMEPTELSNCVSAAWNVTLIQGIRFLTDYLSDDMYYRTRRPEHNLDRCRTQFRLVMDLEQNADGMEKIVDECK